MTATTLRMDLGSSNANRAHSARLTLDELRSFAKDRLAGYKLPRRLELVDQLQRNAAGKTVKYELRTRFRAQRPEGSMT